MGVHRHLNNYREEDGSRNDELETGPLARIDSTGKREMDDAIGFAMASDAESHMRMLQWNAERRAPLQLFIAGLAGGSPAR